MRCEKRSFFLNRTKLEETAKAMEECGHRWSQIETLSGFSLISSPSTHVHTSSSLPGAARVKGLNGVAANLSSVNFTNVPIACHAGIRQNVGPLAKALLLI